MFVAYHVDDCREDGVPVAAHKNRGTALSLAVRRILSAGVTFGEIVVQDRDDISAGDAETIEAIAESVFAKAAQSA